MTTVRDLKLRTRDTVRKLVKPTDLLPRRGYAHFFIEADGIHSRLHLHHFYSLFLPDLDEAVQVHIRVHDAAGNALGIVTRSLTPFASLNLPAAELLSELGSSVSMGTVVLDVEPAARHNQALMEVGPEGAMAQSPFWMGFHNDRGSVAYIHSIDQNYGDVFGVGRLASFAYKARWHRGGPWTSKRLIAADGLSQLDAFLVNHSPASGQTTLRWLAHPSGKAVLEHSLQVAGHGVARATLTSADVERVGGLEGEYLHLEVDDLLTSNGKPYLMARYGAGPFSLHHG